MIIQNIVFFILNSVSANSHSVNTKLGAILNRNVTERDTIYGYSRQIFDFTYEETTFIVSKEDRKPQDLNQFVRLTSNSSLTKRQLDLPDHSGVYKYTSTKNAKKLHSRSKRNDSFSALSPSNKGNSSNALTSTVLVISYPTDKVKRAYCPATLLTTKFVLTSARCISVAYSIVMENKNRTMLTDVYVYAGGNSVKEYEKYVDGNLPLPITSQLRRAEEVIPHYYYCEGCLEFDLALIIVQNAFSLTETVTVSKLSPVPWLQDFPWEYAYCNTIGFEKVKDDYVKTRHSIRVKQPCLCAFKFKAFFLLNEKNSTLSHWICSKPAEDSGVCIDELGSALICNGEIRGLSLSYLNVGELNYCELDPLEFPFHTCGRENTVRIFQHICPALQFIKNITGLFTEEEISQCTEFGFASGIIPKCSGFIVCVFVITNLLGFHG